LVNIRYSIRGTIWYVENVTPPPKKGNNMETYHPLADTLELAVMLHVPEMHKSPFEDLWEELDATKGETATLLGSKGDILLYRSKKKGETANVFNKVARAVALISICVDGGITIFGRTFCNPHPERRS